ncbi:MAG: hypothetical protein ACRCXT_00680 [Paraclostridium sp.]
MLKIHNNYDLEIYKGENASLKYVLEGINLDVIKSINFVIIENNCTSLLKLPLHSLEGEYYFTFDDYLMENIQPGTYIYRIIITLKSDKKIFVNEGKINIKWGACNG